MVALKPADHPAVPAAKIGVLLLNLGTPDSTGYWAMRRYLKEFLSDRRVIDVNPVLWSILLNGVILTKRPFSSGAAYRSIWNKALDESPMRTITREQGALLAEALQTSFGGEVIVDWAMRYGNPSTESRMKALKDQGCDRILIFPLYPQYAGATTGTACDQAFRALMTMRWQPAIRTVPPYHDHPLYVDALARSVERHVVEQGAQPDVLVTSFHGLPKRYVLEGDPYYCQCQKTTRLLRERLGWDKDRVQIAFQSLFGKEEWLRPYTVEHVADLASKGVKSISIIAPGFAADCVETLEEIQVEIKHAFLAAGGEAFTYIPCLNADRLHIELLRSVVERELGGWIEPKSARGLAAAE